MPKKKAQPSAEKAEKAEKALPFEEAMERVESIVDAMETDTLPLEEMLVQYEEGASLLAQCQERIEAAQKRVEVIASERKNGTVTLKAFDGTRDEPIDVPETDAENNEDPEEGSDDIRLF
ncbi:MAG: exodeoxyribonuclease VII small subunit [Verrucomicrobiales bacterium]|jgi:exodeoxyribonuclease VII small subunit